MRFDFTKHRANTSPKPMNGDVRIRAIKNAYYIEFGNSAIDSKDEWNEEKGAMLSSRYRRSK